MFATAILSTVLLTQQEKLDTTETFGKTAPQIVAMGEDAWYDFFIGKMGPETTFSMSRALYYYGLALKEEDDKLISRLPKSKKDEILKLRTNLHEMRNTGIDVARVMTGGGTMWNIVYSNTHTETEKVVRVFLGVDKPEQTAKQSEVWAEINLARKVIIAHKDDIHEGEEFVRVGFAECLESFDKCNSLWNEILNQIKKEPDAVKRGAAMDFVRDCYAMTSDFGEDPSSIR